MIRGVLLNTTCGKSGPECTGRAVKSQIAGKVSVIGHAGGSTVCQVCTCKDKAGPTIVSVLSVTLVWPYF